MDTLAVNDHSPARSSALKHPAQRACTLRRGISVPNQQRLWWSRALARGCWSLAGVADTQAGRHLDQLLLGRFTTQDVDQELCRECAHLLDRLVDRRELGRDLCRCGDVVKSHYR